MTLQRAPGPATVRNIVDCAWYIAPIVWFIHQGCSTSGTLNSAEELVLYLQGRCESAFFRMGPSDTEHVKLNVLGAC